MRNAATGFGYSYHVLPSLPSVRCPAAVSVVSKTRAELNADELLPEELSVTTNFSAKRLAEFSLGRACAHDILSSLGYANFPVRVAETRQPLWPTGLVGSISHAGDIAICAIVPAREVLSIGIDIETLTQESFDLLEEVMNETERAALPAKSGERPYLAKLFFSAKEAVFKCQFPLTGKWLEFKEVSLVPDFANRVFSTVIEIPGRSLTLTGTWDVSDQHILSVAWIT